MESAQNLAAAAAQAIVQHDYSTAEDLYRRVIKIVEAQLSPTNPSELDVAHCFNALADCLEKQDRVEEAHEIKNRAIEIAMKELNEIDGFDR